MGVTTHWFAFNPVACPAPATIDALVAAELLDDTLTPRQPNGPIAAVPSWLEDNKRWYRNIDADWAWTCAREALSPAERAPFDRWFAHLFWQPDPAPPGDSPRAPLPTAPDEVVYDDALLRHLIALAVPLDPVARALERRFPDGAPASADYPWMFTPDGFAVLVDGWQRTFTHATRRHPGWSLLRWVWV